MVFGIIALCKVIEIALGCCLCYFNHVTRAVSQIARLPMLLATHAYRYVHKSGMNLNMSVVETLQAKNPV